MSEEFKRNTIHLHGCGGCGTNIVVEVMRNISDLGTGFSKLKATYFDTTTKNIEHFPEEISEEDYFLVKDDSYKSKEIDGSSGERRMNYDVISKCVADYLDNFSIEGKVNGVYHVVVYSAGGGSGSILGPLLAKALSSRNIPTVTIMVGDSTTGNLSQNTVNTITTVQNLAKANSKPMPVFYLNNQEEKGDVLEEKIQTVNRKCCVFMSGVSLFCSGRNFAIDNQDMASFFDFTDLTSINFPPGAYSVGFYNHKVPSEKDVDHFLGRTLTIEGVSPDTECDLIHWKSGKIVDDTVYKVVDKKQFPLHFVMSSGKLKNEISRLHSEVSAFRKRLEKMAPDKEVVDEKAIVTDDGLVI